MFYFNSGITAPNIYDASKFIEFTNDGFDILSSYFVNKIKDLEVGGFYITSGDVNRLDLVSYKLYKDTQYWWILLIFNDLIDPFNDVKDGMLLRYPKLSALEELYISLKSFDASDKRRIAADDYYVKKLTRPTLTNIPQVLITNETPTGLHNGYNKSFKLTHSAMNSTEEVRKNGILLVAGTQHDYIIVGNTLYFFTPPATNDVLLVNYWSASTRQYIAPAAPASGAITFEVTPAEVLNDITRLYGLYGTNLDGLS